MQQPVATAHCPYQSNRLLCSKQGPIFQERCQRCSHAAAAPASVPVTTVNGGGGEAAVPTAAFTCPCPPERSHERGVEDNTAAGSTDAADGGITTYSEPFLYPFFNYIIVLISNTMAQYFTISQLFQMSSSCCVGYK